MTDYFNWHSDDDGSWDAPLPIEEGEIERRPGERLRAGLLIATAIALVLLIAILVNQDAGQVVDEATSNAQAELRAANRLILEAALEGDVELFSQLLSRQDMQWHSDQRVIVRRQLFHDRAPLAIWLDRPALAASKTPFLEATVSLAPDLNSAEVFTTLPYLTLTADGNLQSVQLRRRIHYQRVGDRWLLVPSEDRPVISGEAELAYEGEILKFAYPERDQEVVLRLAGDVDAMLKGFCRQLAALSCDPGISFEATLSDDPSSLLGLDRAFLQPRYRIYLTRSVRTSDRIILPAPSLVGLATDEASYQALFRGYGSWLATAFIYRQIDPIALSSESYLALLASAQLVPPPPGEYNPLLTLESPPIPVPDQEVRLHCTYNSEQSEFWFFDPKTETWSSEPVAAPVEPLLPETLFQEVVSPDGRMVAIAHEVDRSAVIDLWSGDKARLIRRLPNAEDPFWLDQYRLGYIQNRRLAADEQPAGATLAVTESDLVFVTLDEGQRMVAETRLTASQLRAAVNLFQKPGSLHINDVLVRPGPDERLFLLARAATGVHDVYLFAVDKQLAEIEFLDRWRDNGSSDLPLQITSDGRFLTVTRYGFSRTYISIYDNVQRDRQMISVAGRPDARFDWSDDQQWLAIASDRLLWLVAPAFDYAVTIPHNIAGCWSASWMASGTG